MSEQHSDQLQSRSQLGFPSNNGVRKEVRLATSVARLVVDLYEANPADMFVADHHHEELSRGAASVAWEGSGMDCWVMTFTEHPSIVEYAAKHGLFFEPINNITLGIYPVQD